MDVHESGGRSTTIASTAGGVMTHEAGAVTGDLEIFTRPSAGTLDVSVRYAGADEWYSVTGSPVSLRAAGGEPAPADLHERVVEHLTQPGPVAEGNEQPTSLLGFSPARS